MNVSVCDDPELRRSRFPYTYAAMLERHYYIFIDTFPSNVLIQAYMEDMGYQNTFYFVSGHQVHIHPHDLVVTYLTFTDMDCI